jgi:putative hydrolase of the HAD superfamily
MTISTIFFDLDDTLYPNASGIWPMIRQRINQYMLERLKIESEKVHELRRSLFETYGTTMRGLQATYEIDTEEFLAYVHDVPVEERLQKDPVLRDQLESYPYRKIIFTNADDKHAKRVLRTLQLEDCFEQIIDIHQISPSCKPQPEAYIKALQIAEERDANRCLMIDDAPANLLTARSLGFYTILVGPKPTELLFDGYIDRLVDLPEVLSTLVLN